ncbi:hypothetical protein [Pantoea stewartii]|uniref:hypothetical protein n=1 Tax=Pantoea stewartii TaxID=66269 RepID=UPI0025A07341|nr:hypothetical protein [Pantoea stewartii]
MTPRPNFFDGGRKKPACRKLMRMDEASQRRLTCTRSRKLSQLRRRAQPVNALAHTRAEPTKPSAAAAGYQSESALATSGGSAEPYQRAITSQRAATVLERGINIETGEAYATEIAQKRRLQAAAEMVSARSFNTTPWPAVFWAQWCATTPDVALWRFAALLRNAENDVRQVARGARDDAEADSSTSWKASAHACR